MPHKIREKGYVETITINKRIVNMGNCSLNVVALFLINFCIVYSFTAPIPVIYLYNLLSTESS